VRKNDEEVGRLFRLLFSSCTSHWQRSIVAVATVHDAVGRSSVHCWLSSSVHIFCHALLWFINYTFPVSSCLTSLLSRDGTVPMHFSSISCSPAAWSLPCNSVKTFACHLLTTCDMIRYGVFLSVVIFSIFLSKQKISRGLLRTVTAVTFDVQAREKESERAFHLSLK